MAADDEEFVEVKEEPAKVKIASKRRVPQALDAVVEAEADEAAVEPPAVPKLKRAPRTKGKPVGKKGDDSAA